jgi:ATP synthase subunit 6
MFVYSPLEQFEIIPLMNMFILGFDVSVTNVTLFMFSTAFLVFFIVKISFVEGLGYLIPTRLQYCMEQLFVLTFGLLKDGVERKYLDLFFPYIFSSFMFILFANLLGLIPYGYTVTAQLIVTITFSFALWLGKLIIGFRLHGLKILSILLPKGSPFFMVPFLVLIELITFMITIISLSVRLFANMMAGHILLKVFAGFAWTMLTSGGFLYFLHFFPLVVLLALLGLEFGVALVQAYVFTMLSCLYLGDMVSGGH